MTHIHSFPAISDYSATRLILGSMPGKASLEAGQYYAHPRNLFWKALNTFDLVDSGASYPRRCQQLIEQRIALWDVLKLCTRTSSLDSDIVASSMVANDLRSFLIHHPNVTQVFFNGAKAQQIYQRYVLPEIGAEFSNLTTTRLPSTSPANAAISEEVKLAAWRAVAVG